MRFIARADAMAAAECLDGARARGSDSPEAIRQPVGSTVSTAAPRVARSARHSRLGKHSAGDNDERDRQL